MTGFKPEMVGGSRSGTRFSAAEFYTCAGKHAYCKNKVGFEEQKMFFFFECTKKSQWAEVRGPSISQSLSLNFPSLITHSSISFTGSYFHYNSGMTVDKGRKIYTGPIQITTY